jgi:hypothetical protein
MAAKTLSLSVYTGSRSDGEQAAFNVARSLPKGVNLSPLSRPIKIPNGEMPCMDSVLLLVLE